MNVKFIIIQILLVTVFSSCLNKTKCNLEPIASNVLDSVQLKGDFIFKNQRGNIDTLVLIDHYNVLNKSTIKSLMTYEECGHSIGFDYKSINKIGTVSVGLDKNNKNEYRFSINGFCISQDIELKREEAEKDSLIIINVKKCSESQFKIIAFRKFKIEYFITQDGDIWKPAVPSVP